jgi:hypothetical protein
MAGLFKLEKMKGIKRTIPCDEITIEGERFELNPDSAWLPAEANTDEVRSELTESLRPMLQGLGECSAKTENGTQAEIEEVQRLYNCAFNDFLEERGLKVEKFAVPSDPVTWQVIRGLNRKQDWVQDEQGELTYTCRGNKGHLILSFNHSPQEEDIDIAIWEYVKHLSVETVDVFLILLNKIASIWGYKPGDRASITMEKIAQQRGVQHRGGSKKNLHDHLLRDIKLIADLRLTMVWKHLDETLTFGKDLPEPLIHITDWEYEGRGRKLKAFRFRPGEPLGHFLFHEKGRLVMYICKRLLDLDPYRDALAKKIGVYLSFLGVSAAGNRSQPTVKVETILNFCGEDPNYKRPKDTVEKVRAAFQKLADIALIPCVPEELEPQDKGRGYINRWLEQVLTIEINPHLLTIRGEDVPELPPAIAPCPEVSRQDVVSQGEEAEAPLLPIKAQEVWKLWRSPFPVEDEANMDILREMVEEDTFEDDPKIHSHVFEPYNDGSGNGDKGSDGQDEIPLHGTHPADFHQEHERHA